MSKSNQTYYCLKCGYVANEPKGDCPRCFCTAWGKQLKQILCSNCNNIVWTFEDDTLPYTHKMGLCKDNKSKIPQNQNRMDMFN